MYNLIIVESPAKCKKIESILGKEYKCLASYGHICSLNDLNQIDFNHYENNEYKIIKEKTKNINNLKKEIQIVLKNKKEIIIATDNDREGEGIGYYLCYFCNLPLNNTKRILFNEITKSALLKSINNPIKLNLNIIHSQQTRQILDLCLGFKISPLLWKNVYYGLSAGRCQTPALNMIYDCKKELDKYVENPLFKWNIKGIFGDKNWEFKLLYNETNISKSQDIHNYLELCKNYDFKCKILKLNNEKRYPPIPLITSSLQQNCSKLFGFTSKMTMKYAQDLYESGLITYMRTDSTSMSIEFINTAVDYIKKKYGDQYVSSSVYSRGENKSKQKSQEAHECIRITEPETKNISDTFSNQHTLLYEYIWKVSIQTLMSNSEYFKIKLQIPSPYESIFEKVFYMNKFDGYEKINKTNQYETMANEYNYIVTYLFCNKDCVKIENKKIQCENEPIKIPKLLNESGLIKKLESYNIGRPSTYASIIQSLENKYITKEKNQKICDIMVEEYILQNNSIENNKKNKEINETNKYSINEKGINALLFCFKYFNEIFNYDFTNNLENDLDLIANGSKNKKDICVMYNNMIDKYIKTITHEESEYKIKTNVNKINLGKYENTSIYLNKGKYGYYLEYKKEKYTVKNDNIEISEYSLENAIENINNIKKEKETNIVRVINSDISIRKSNYGDYIYFKTNKMKNPKFINLKKFNSDYINCDINDIISYVEQEKNVKRKYFKKIIYN